LDDLDSDVANILDRAVVDVVPDESKSKLSDANRKETVAPEKATPSSPPQEETKTEKGESSLKKTGFEEVPAKDNDDPASSRTDDTSENSVTLVTDSSVAEEPTLTNG